MKKKHRPLVAGNWKMNPSSVGAAKKLFLEIQKGLKRQKQKMQIVIAPPFPYLSELQRLSPSRRIELGAQDVFHESVGAYTGEVSLPILKSVGVTVAIIGHSERRALGETDAQIAKDVKAAIKNNVTTILCVGEAKRDAHGGHFNVVEEQLRAGLAGVPKTKAKQLVIAYEPVWAIGTGNTATPEDVEEMKLFIQKALSDLFDRKTADAVRILYGGSVNKKNAASFLETSDIGGFLIGGASLRGAEFVEIVKTTAAYAEKK